MGAKWFGAEVKRKEDPALLTGKGRYVDDLHLPGMLHAAFTRSPFAHALVKKIDVSAARSLPGVHTVLTYADLPEWARTPLPMFQPNPAIIQMFMPCVLAKEEVCFVGEAIAIVIAESRHIAEDAASLVDVDYAPLPAVSDFIDALEPSAPSANSQATSNLVAKMRLSVGNVDTAFARAAHVFSESLMQHRGGAFFMECRGLVVGFDHSGMLTIHIGSQTPHRLHRVLIDLLGWDESRIRVIAPDVGGGFGPKGQIYQEYLAVIAATLQLERPVKWIEDRRENFLATQHERDQQWNMEIATDHDARILGVRGRLIHDAGAYLPWGVVLPWIAATTLPGPYVLPNYNLDILVSRTNKISTTPVRGASRPQAVFAMERLMDRVAQEFGLDRAEVRRRNMIRADQMPYEVGITFRDGRPVTYDSGDYPACQAKLLTAAKYDGFKHRQSEARQAGRYIGIGIANAVEATGLGPYESATVRVATNGKISVYIGAPTQGQSHKTTMAQIVADHFNVHVDDVNVTTGDTGTISQGMGAFASRVAVTAGSSAHLAAAYVAEKVKAIAAEMLEVAPSDLEFKDGKVEVIGVPGHSKSLREVAVQSIGRPGFSMSGGPSPGLESTAFFQPDQSTYSNSSHLAEVAVDIETGEIEILRYIVVHDCGNMINPLVVEGQVVGGVAHGIGNALFERMIYDDDAQPLSTNFAEYLLPLATDVPPIEVLHLTSPTPLNPLGVKGAGEGGTIPAAAAIISAIEDALSPFGIRILETPVSPERIVALLEEAGHSAR